MMRIELSTRKRPKMRKTDGNRDASDAPTSARPAKPRSACSPKWIEGVEPMAASPRRAVCGANAISAATAMSQRPEA